MPPVGYEISTDPQRLDMDRIHRFLSTEAYSSPVVPGDCVQRPLPNRELLVPLPRRPPTAAVLDRAREVGAGRVACWTAGHDLDLSELGFQPGWEPHWMAVVTRAEPLDQRVSEADDVPEYDDYGRRLLDLTRRPESYLFVAREDGRFAGHGWRHVTGG